MSMRGWSGALPNDIQSFPTLEDVRRAICQVRCPERNKETVDAHPLFVSPCILSTPVYSMQECDNKVVQKSASSIKFSAIFPPVLRLFTFLSYVARRKS